MMKITIVTPSFNQGEFIADAIESVTNQDYPYIEHLVIDAQSTDETINVLKQYDHLPHLKWVSEPDKGQADAINKGFKSASGDIVGWLNADDYYLPGTLAKIAEIFQQNSQVDIVYGEAMFVDQNKQLVKRQIDHRFDYSVLLYYGCYIQSTSTFFRKSIIDAGHLLDIYYKICMDYEYYIRLANAGYKFEYLPKPLAAFRWQGNNASRVYAQKREEETLKIKRQYGFQLPQKFKSFQIPSFVYRFIKFAVIGKRQILKVTSRITPPNPKPYASK